MTQCSEQKIVCKRLGRREVVTDFGGGQLTSDGGAMLLGKVDEQLGLLERFAGLFTDYRKPEATEHTVTELVRQRVYGIALGYEDLYCARGEMENRIKEQQLCLFADRTSTSPLRANQIRLWFSSLAYMVMNALRREGLRDTELARARCDTIGLKLLKIGAGVKVTARRVWIALSSSFPLKGLFRKAWRRLEELPRQPAWVPQRC